MAIALLQEEGKLSFDDPIADHFPEYTDENTHPWIRQTTIKNCLQMRTCHAASTYKVDMKSDWVESFFKVAPTHKPGTIFHYDTSAAHTLCALAEKLTGMSMLDYLKEKAPDMEIILLTLPVSKLYSTDRQVELNNIIKDLASEYNLKLVDLASVDIRGNLVDSAHPKASGMKLISDAIIEALTTK